ncbi:carbamoyltransferase [Candidatus Pelagibacter ubique]|uniref:Carbamoyltransferase n=1 Tax=Pelagibacter ubique TaxID=198252 RepID=A0ABX1T0S9_PELUQ|nr:carbamoyltransferase C-terminal domain-containing protein [Candidatus Pelagibacter ubique]NMN67084.1 carbamoyltransferase [Candidatus Pelagibacter ubique]
MYTIGIHYGHDSNVSLIENGKCVFAISEERLTRVKFDNRWPKESINYIFKKFNLNSENIAAVAVVGSSKQEETSGGSIENIYKKFDEQTNLFTKIYSKIINPFDNIFSFLKIRKKITINFVKKKIFKLGINEDKIFFLDHHFCHAVGAFYASNFEEALIVTCDGKGDDSCHKSFEGKKDENGLSDLKLIAKSDPIDSIGFFYSTITEFLGFKRMRHEGKITGLAAFGKKDYEKDKFPIELSLDGLSLNNNLINEKIKKSKFLLFFKFLIFDYKLFFKVLFNNAAIEGRFSQLVLKKFISNKFLKEDKTNVAKYAQIVLENTLKELIQNTLKIVKASKICLSGGVFANVKLNQKIYEITKKEIYVMPGMDDGGLSIGAGLYIFEKKLNKPIVENFENIYYGPSYDEQHIRVILNNSGFKFKKIDFIEKKIAEELAAGNIVGRFNGRMEWGPRALGNRSIFANPKNKEINTTLNKRLSRTEFMPFAPIILEEDAEDYFENYNKFKCFEFMTMTLKVKNEKIQKIPAVVHVDNTARPQCVKKKINESLYILLKEYKKLTEIPVLINTSFNLHEEPIVCTPIDALKALERNAVDFLAIENFWVEKKSS